MKIGVIDRNDYCAHNRDKLPIFWRYFEGFFNRISYLLCSPHDVNRLIEINRYWVLAQNGILSTRKKIRFHLHSIKNGKSLDENTSERQFDVPQRRFNRKGHLKRKEDKLAKFAENWISRNRRLVLIIAWFFSRNRNLDHDKSYSHPLPCSHHLILE